MSPGPKLLSASSSIAPAAATTAAVGSGRVDLTASVNVAVPVSGPALLSLTASLTATARASALATLALLGVETGGVTVSATAALMLQGRVPHVIGRRARVVSSLPRRGTSIVPSYRGARL